MLLLDFCYRCMPYLYFAEHHKKGSNIISRISKSRRERHERACDEMHQLLVLTATEFEPKLEAIGSDLTAKLSENDRQLEVALARLEPEAVK